MSKAKELAEKINGRNIGQEVTTEDIVFAEDNNLVIAFGASDDLLELRGVVDDEIGAWGGIKGIISAIWCPDYLKTSWLITTKLSHYHFDIFDDGELYCRGFVMEVSKDMKIGKMYVIKLPKSSQPCWFDGGNDGDPSRTLLLDDAKKYKTIESAEEALERLECEYPNREYEIEQILEEIK